MPRPRIMTEDKIKRLQYLWNEKKLSSKECAKELNLNPASISPWLSYLRRKGYYIESSKSQYRRPRTIFTSEEQEYIIRRTMEGVPPRSIAEYLQCDHTTIRRFVRNNNLPFVSNKREWTEEKKQEFARLYNANVKPIVLSEKYDIQPRSIYSVVQMIRREGKITINYKHHKRI